MPEYMDVGAVMETAVGTNDGWALRVRFPTREALGHVYQFCRDHDIPVRIDAVYDQQGSTRRGAPSLTEAQRRILVEAIECGYLTIPRESSLAELSDRLGISESAASERFRRAVRNLVEQTVLA